MAPIKVLNEAAAEQDVPVYQGQPAGWSDADVLQVLCSTHTIGLLCSFWADVLFVVVKSPWGTILLEIALSRM